MKKLHVGLLPRIVIAIILGILFGNFLPAPLVRLFVTFNGIFSEFLNFSIPLIIVGLVTVAIADIGRGAGRMLLVGTAQIAAKTTRDSQGVAVVTLKKNQTIASVVPADTLELANPHRYRVRSLPATGALIRAEDEGEQMTLL